MIFDGIKQAYRFLKAALSPNGAITTLAGKALRSDGGMMNKQDLVRLFAVSTAAVPGLLLSASIASAQAISSDGISRVGAQGNLWSRRPYRKRITRRDDGAGTFQRRFRNRLQLQSGTRGPGAPRYVSRSLFPGWTGVQRCAPTMERTVLPLGQGIKVIDASDPAASGGEPQLDRHPRGA